jgi:hypothetical protein
MLSYVTRGTVYTLLGRPDARVFTKILLMHSALQGADCVLRLVRSNGRRFRS